MTPVKVSLGLAALAAAATVTIAAYPSAQAPTSFAYVSTEVVLQRTPGFTAAESTWTAEVTEMRAGLEGLSQQIDSALSAFDQVSMGLSPAERQDRQTELIQWQRQYAQRTNEAQTRAEQRRRELMAPLQTRIRSVIDGIRAERNLGVVFDVSAPGTGIISADPGLDLTALVVRRLAGGS